MQLAEMQLRSLEIFAAQQKSQIDVYQELTRSNKEKEHDTLFTSIPVFDGDRTQCEQWLDGHGPSYKNQWMRPENRVDQKINWCGLDRSS